MKTYETDKGDSGGPWVDSDGALLGIHHGHNNPGWFRDEKWNVAVVGEPALIAIGAYLYK